MAIPTPSKYSASAPQVPAGHAVIPTPDAELEEYSRAIYVGVGGNVSVVMARDSVTAVFVGVPAGTVLPIRVSQVNSIGTTASNLLALI